jgi:arylsulfatase A-like enzyme
MGGPHRREVVSGAVAALAAAGEAPAQPASRPNLILYFPDEMRADAAGCYGNAVCRTPNLDRLAREGARFDQCHVQYTVCGASRCSLLTGWPTSVHGHRSLYYFLRPDEPNLFRCLRQAGYDVFWYGKNDALAQASFPDSVTHWADYPGRDQAEIRAAFTSGASLTPGATSMLFAPMGDRRGSSDYANLQAAIRILERRETERPFCIFLPLSNPHPPYTAPADFCSLYRPDDVEPLIPPNLPKRPSYHAAIRRSFGLDRLTDGDFRRVRAAYYAQVTYADWMLGELLEAMERTGRARDTAIVVSSDHGDYAGDYGLVEKWPSALEDCLTHVPLVARAPGGRPGVVSGGMVELYDVMATFLELAGTRAQHTHFARSFAPHLRGAPADLTRAAFSEGGYDSFEPQAFEPILAGLYEPKTRLQNEHPEHITRCASIRTRTHRLVVRPEGQSELYDCAADPGLTRNLIDDRAHAGSRAGLERRLLDRYIETTGVPPTDKDPRGLPPSPAPPA